MDDFLLELELTTLIQLYVLATKPLESWEDIALSKGLISGISERKI